MRRVFLKEQDCRRKMGSFCPAPTVYSLRSRSTLAVTHRLTGSSAWLTAPTAWSAIPWGKPESHQPSAEAPEGAVSQANNEMRQSTVPLARLTAQAVTRTI